MNAAGFPRRALRTASTGLAIVALTVVYFWPVLAAKRFIAGDFLAETYPFRRYATQELFAGRLPHWSPYVGFGFPFLADPETTVFYPVSLLGSLLAGADISYHRLQWEMIAHYGVAALGMALLGFRTNLGWAGALVGGCVFAFSGFLWAHGGHATVVQSASWLPWILLGAAALLERPGVRAAVGTATAMALSLLGGHPQITYYAGLAFIVALGVVRWPAGGDATAVAHWRRAWGLTWSVALTLALAGGLVAIQLLPTAALTRDSVRWGRGEDFLQVGQLPLEHLLTLVLPFAFGGTPFEGPLDETHCYLGILPLLLAAWALVRRRDRWTAAFAAVAAAGLLLALDVRPVSWIASVGYFRIPSRAILLFDLGVAALAARGADALWQPADAPTAGERRLVRGFGVATVVVGIVAVSLLVGGVPAGLSGFLARDFPSQFQRLALWLTAATVGIVVARRLRRPVWAAPALILGLLVLEILSFPRERVWGAQGAEYRWPALANVEALAAQGEPYRVGGDLYGFGRTMENNAGLVYRVPMAPIYSSLGLRRVAPVHDLLRHAADLDPYRLAGIKWILASQHPALRGLNGERLRTLQLVGPNLWVVPDALPRAHLPAEVHVVPAKHARVRALATLDPRRTVLVERRSVSCPARARGPEPGVEFLADEPQRVVLRVRALEAGPLVLSDAYYLGWRATVDGAPVPIARANHAFRMVCVPAGEHVVEFTFQQPGFQLGLALTTLSGAVAAALIAVPRILAWRAGLGRRLRARARRAS